MSNVGDAIYLLTSPLFEFAGCQRRHKCRSVVSKTNNSVSSENASVVKHRRWLIASSSSRKQINWTSENALDCTRTIVFSITRRVSSRQLQNGSGRNNVTVSRGCYRKCSCV